MDSRLTMRRGAAPALVAVVALMLSGCSPSGLDETLTTAVSDAISAGASAQLGLELSEQDQILAGTLTALLGDMEQALADTERELQMHQTSDPENAEYRADALLEVRESLEAVHIALAGDKTTALTELTASVEQLRELEGGG